MANFDYQKFCADHIQIVDKQAHMTPFILNEVQKRFLTERSNRSLILKARQQGFSTLLVAMAVIRFIFQQNFYAMIIANDADNASGLLDRAKIMLRSIEESYHQKVPLKYNSRYELHNSENNATILIGTAQNVDVGRSKTINFLHASEAAFFRDLPKFLSSALQAVPENGEVYLESTANGFNYYKSLWDAAILRENNFKPLFFPASDFYEPQYLESKKKELGRYFPQEYPETPEEAFLTSGETYFDKDALKYYLDGSTKPDEAAQKIDGPYFRSYRSFERGEFVVCFADTAQGGNDYCAAQFLSKDKLDVPLVFHANVSATLMTPLLHQKLEEIYDQTGVQPCIAYERNNGGQFELDRLQVLNKIQKYYLYEQLDKHGKPSGKYGWDTNTATRPKMVQELQECLRGKVLYLYDAQTINELFSFIVTKSGKPEAEKNAHDDLVMALAGAWQLYQSESKPQKVDYVAFMQEVEDDEMFTRDGLY